MSKVVLLVSFGLFFSSALLSWGEEDYPHELVKAIQTKPEAFELITVDPEEPTDFKVPLGVATVTDRKGKTLDGFRFVAPKGSDKATFVWYFNAPSVWGHWYLCPVKGKLEQSFRNWFNGDCLYQKFDKPGEKDRLRVHQTLAPRYFEPGESYVMWFNRKLDEESVDEVRGRIQFTTKKEERWTPSEGEELLKLERQPSEIQAEHLGSRGAKILVDRNFFDAGYADSRIDSMFFSKRRVSRMKGGFFITIQTHVPVCTQSPSIDRVMKKYGQPDLVVTAAQQAQLAKRQGDEDAAIENDIYYYDHFGFEVAQDGKDSKIRQVSTHGADYRKINPDAKGKSFARLDLKNLVVFRDEGREVGRLYYFLEEEKEPLVVKLPPVGVYKQPGFELEYLGEGRWKTTYYHRNGKVFRTDELQKNLLNGPSKWFFGSGEIRFEGRHRDGLLEGILTEYDQGGNVVKKINYKAGKIVKEPEASARS